MKTFYTLFAMVLMLLVSGTAFSQTKTWTGASSTAWNTASNWSPAGVPTAANNVTIPSAPAKQPLISGTSTPVCNNLTVNAGALLTISGTSTNNAQLSVAGTATFNGGLSIGGVLAKTGKLIAANVVWNSTASISSFIGGRMEVSGNWTFASGSSIEMGFTSVTFTGTGNSTIYSNSASSKFNSLTINKTGLGKAYIGASSTATLTITGVLILGTGAVLMGQANILTILKGNLISSGNIYMEAGTLSFEKSSGIQEVQINSNDSFYAVKINSGGTVKLVTSYYLILKSSFHIQSGIFDPDGNMVVLWGDWTNSVGPDAFVEGMGTVIFNGGNYHQYCSNENFYNLEVNKTLGGALRINGTTVSCSHYNWTAGAIDVLSSGTFTANDLIDDAIAGSFYCNSGGTINLSNYGGNIDLRGNLYIYGGTFNVYGGVNPSWWPYQGNASLAMTGGMLNFADQGILIKTDATYSFTNNITGGTIKTVGDFTNGRTDFIPTAGTVELYGAANSNLTMTAGKIFNLTVNKNIVNTVTLSTNATLDGALTVQSGTFSSTAKVITLASTLNINSGGVLYMGHGSELKLASGKYLNVNNGGLLKCEGAGADNVNITHSAGYYFLSVKNGGTISAKYTYFQYLNYVQLMSGSTLDPANAFYRCTFTNNSGAPLGAVLNFATDQVVTIHEANFPALNSGYNVLKSNDVGRVTFKDATGAYAGPTYENDPYNRIDWTATQPGLWTGTVSTDWWTSANWDDGNVPNAVTDVVIPATATYMPTIGAGVASSKSVTVNGILTIAAADLNVAQNVTINGTLAMNNAGAELSVQGDIAWNSGSVASITADAQIHAYGHWNFNAGANANLANGTVFFMGSSSKWIRNYSTNSSFFNVRSQKTGGAQIGFSDLSAEDLKINGYLLTFTGSKFVSDSQEDVVVKGNITSQGILQCNFGAVKLDGANQSITPNVNDYFNHLVFSQTGTANIINTNTNIIVVKGDLHIDSGIFNAGSSIIKVGGNWENNIGPDAFAEGGSRVVFNGGNYQQYIYQDENFATLEINKTLGKAVRIAFEADVYCTDYDWTAGAVDVMSGSSFTAPSLTNGITGNFYATDGGTITLGQYGSDPQLKGNLYINGGKINIIAAIESQWPGNGNASITMSDGELNVYPYGIEIVNNPPYTFTTNITGGSIRAEGNFINSRSDFNPTVGTIEMYGSEDAGIQMSAGSINNLIINKTGSKTVTLLSNATVNGILNVESGTLKATNKILTTGGNIAINNGGILWMDLNSQLKIGTSKVLTVNSGGTIRVEGSSGNEAVVTRSGAIGNYVINVTNGGTIAAQHATFYYIDPLIVRAGATIAEPNPFSYCKFRYSSNVGMLRIDNSQDLTIHNVEFLQPATGFNVSKSVDNGSLQFIDFYGDFAGLAFENDPYNRIFWGDEFATHNISIPAGWSGISSFVIPNQPAMEAVFAPISSELIIAQTMTQIYYPGENINTIGNWESQSAYKVKTSATCTLPVIGEYETDMTVSLNAGWSLLPVVSPVGADASDLLIPANGFVIAKDVAGTGVFWPQYGINTIGTLLPGKAYFVLMTAPGVVDYTGTKSSGNHTGLQDLSGLEGFGIQPTPSTHTIAILPTDTKDIEIGTTIGAFDQNGNCFGLTIICEGANHLTIFGDDPTTVAKDGFFEGEIIFFKTPTGFKTLSGLTPTYDNSLPQFDGLFTENGLSAIKGFESSTGVEFNDFSSLVNIFPNPSDGAVKITGLQSGAKISVTDVHGQRVLIESCLSDDLKTIDLTSFNPGIYFIKIQQNGETIFRKVVLK